MKNILYIDGVNINIYDNLCIIEMINLSKINKFYNKLINNYIKNNLDYIKKKYFPVYKIKEITEIKELKTIFIINHINILYVDKNKLLIKIMNNNWSREYFNNEYINNNLKIDYYIYDLVIGIMKDIYLVNQLKLLQKNKILLNKNILKDKIYDLRICFAKLIDELLDESEILKKTLDNYVDKNIKIIYKKKIDIKNIIENHI